MQNTMVTYEQLRNARPALQRLSAIPLPAKTALILSRYMKLIFTELDTFFDQHKALILKMGGTENAGNLTVPPANLPAFQSEFQTMLALELSIPLPPLDFELLAGCEITTADLLALDFLFVQRDEPTPE